MSDVFDETRVPLDIPDDIELGALVALSGLPGLSPPRFWSLLELDRPSGVWNRVCSDGLPFAAKPRGGGAKWSAWAATADPARMLAAHRHAGVDLLPFGASGYPSRLRRDREPPALLFGTGPAARDDDLAVALVGTRDCTRYGRQVALELATALAARGVTVVSGLATGIDASAHAGAGRSDPSRCAAVVASGLDVVYPKGNRGLWQAVSEHGRLYSEWPLGSSPLPWRFPARNRLVAALSVAVVVVESRIKGGSMYTVDEAVRRDRPVFAVPGSIHSPASTGTNRLIAEGAQILCSIDALVDALAPLPATARGQGRLDLEPGSGTGSADAPTEGDESWLLQLLGWEPMLIDSIVAESGQSPVDVTLEVERELAAGRIARQGARIERIR